MVQYAEVWVSSTMANFRINFISVFPGSWLLLCQTSKFLPGDRVWYRESGSGAKQGKFIVVKGPSAGKYYLAAIDNVKVLVLGGKVVGENELEGA